MSIFLKRRALLKAAAPAAAALPLLDLTHGNTAKAGGAGGIPNRYVFVYCGMSSGRDGAGQQIVPTTTGPGYDLPRSLMPLGADPLPYGGNGYGVADEVSVVTGLTIPWGDAGQTPPPGGKSPEFHYNTIGPLVSGVRGESTRTGYARGESSDQIVARAIADKDHRHLVYRVQPVKYVGDNGGGGNAGRVSWLDDGGGLSPVESNASPRLAYESLFSTFVPPDDELAIAALHRRRKVLDMLRARTETLLPRLGAGDTERMQKHYEEILALENRIDMLASPEGVCMPPADPGEDPPIGMPHNTTAEGNLDYTEGAGYSEEDLRAEVLFDLIHMAFACDLSRVAAVRMSFDQCFMNMAPLTGATGDVHEMSHGATGFDDFADAAGVAHQAFRPAGLASAGLPGVRRLVDARPHGARARVRGRLRLRPGGRQRQPGPLHREHGGPRGGSSGRPLRRPAHRQNRRTSGVGDPQRHASSGCRYRRARRDRHQRARAVRLIATRTAGGTVVGVTLEELRTTEDAGRSRPSHGRAWDDAVAAGIDVTLLEHNLTLSPRERLRRLCDHLRHVERVQARTVPAAIRERMAEKRLRDKLEALGLTAEEALPLDEHG